MRVEIHKATGFSVDTSIRAVECGEVSAEATVLRILHEIARQARPYSIPPRAKK